jgi:hypothetical protein
MNRRIGIPTAFLLSLILVMVSNASAQVGVPGTANIFGAGHASPPEPSGHGAGSLPPVIAIPAGINRTIQFSTSGTISYGPCCLPNDADGISGSGVPTSIYGGLVGPQFPTQLRYLSGVFLDNTDPADPAPSPLVFTDDAFTTLSPGLRQIFVVGDGVTGNGSGTVQTFHIPNGATRLFLGFIDFWTPDGLPGGYGDNSGSISVTTNLSPTDVGDIPALNELQAAYPNPFVNSTSITVSPGESGNFRLEVIDVTGHRVRLLNDGPMQSIGRFEWNGRADDGHRASSGVYYVRLTSPEGVATRSLVLLR